MRQDFYADVSASIEIPKENLKLLAPEKDHKSVYAPMRYIQQESLKVRKNARNTATLLVSLLQDKAQMIVGATAETDKDILYLRRPSAKDLRCGVSTIRAIFPSIPTISACRH